MHVSNLHTYWLNMQRHGSIKTYSSRKLFIFITIFFFNIFTHRTCVAESQFFARSNLDSVFCLVSILNYRRFKSLGFRGLLPLFLLLSKCVWTVKSAVILLFKLDLV